MGDRRPDRCQLATTPSSLTSQLSAVDLSHRHLKLSCCLIVNVCPSSLMTAAFCYHSKHFVIIIMITCGRSRCGSGSSAGSGLSRCRASRVSCSGLPACLLLNVASPVFSTAFRFDVFPCSCFKAFAQSCMSCQAFRSFDNRRCARRLTAADRAAPPAARRARAFDGHDERRESRVRCLELYHCSLSLRLGPTSSVAYHRIHTTVRYVRRRNV